MEAADVRSTSGLFPENPIQLANMDPLSFPIPSPAFDGSPRSYLEPDTNNTERENWT